MIAFQVQTGLRWHITEGYGLEAMAACLRQSLEGRNVPVEDLVERGQAESMWARRNSDLQSLGEMENEEMDETVTVAEVSANLCRDCTRALQKRHDWLLALVSGLRL